MFTARSKSITIIAALLIVLALLSTVSTLTSPTGFAGGRPPGQSGAAGGNFQGNNNGGNPPQGNQDNSGNLQGGSRTPQGSGGFNLSSIFRSVGINPQISGYINIGLTILVVILALLSAWSVWKQKRWGLNLAMVLALLFLVAAVPGLFSLGGRNINWLRAALNILTLLASAPILVMGILPSVRDSVS
jgi:hypothetical protein